MKKLILTTSALTLMGTAAMADITLGGEASVKYSNWGTAAGTAASFSFDTKLTATLEQTAGDLTYGAKVTVDADAGTVSDGVIYVSGGFGKVSFGIDEFDETSEDIDGALDINGATAKEKLGDVKYEGTFGAVSATLVADAGLGNMPTPTGPAWDLGLKYKGGSFNASLDTDSTNAWKLAADTTFGNYTVGASVNDSNAIGLWVKTSFGGVNAKLTADDVTGSAVYGLALDGKAGMLGWELSGDSSNAVAAKVSYDADPWSVSLAYDNDDAGTVGVKDRGDAADIILTVGYKVNDNLKFEMKANDVSEYEIKMTAGFTF